MSKRDDSASMIEGDAKKEDLAAAGEGGRSKSSRRRAKKKRKYPGNDITEANLKVDNQTELPMDAGENKNQPNLNSVVPNVADQVEKQRKVTPEPQSACAIVSNEQALTAVPSNENDSEIQITNEETSVSPDAPLQEKEEKLIPESEYYRRRCPRQRTRPEFSITELAAVAREEHLKSTGEKIEAPEVTEPLDTTDVDQNYIDLPTIALKPDDGTLQWDTNLLETIPANYPIHYRYQPSSPLEPSGSADLVLDELVTEIDRHDSSTLPSPVSYNEPFCVLDYIEVVPVDEEATPNVEPDEELPPADGEDNLKSIRQKRKSGINTTVNLSTPEQSLATMEILEQILKKHFTLFEGQDSSQCIEDDLTTTQVFTAQNAPVLPNDSNVSNASTVISTSTSNCQANCDCSFEVIILERHEKKCKKSENGRFKVLHREILPSCSYDVKRVASADIANIPADSSSYIESVESRKDDVTDSLPDFKSMQVKRFEPKPKKPSLFKRLFGRKRDD